MRICHCTAPYTNPNACNNCPNNKDLQEYGFAFDWNKPNYDSHLDLEEILKKFAELKEKEQ